MKAIDRFWSHVDRRGPDECWEWTGYCNKDGYGKFSPVAGKPISAHRWIFQYRLNKKLRRNEHVLHKCDNPPCVNPKHLFLGNPLKNARDKVRKNRANTKPVNPSSWTGIRRSRRNNKEK